MEVKNWSDLTDAILLRKTSFLVAFFVVFISSYAVLHSLDWLPELVLKEDRKESVMTTEAVIDEASLLPAVVEEPAKPAFVHSVPDLPLTLKISAINKEVTVLNPTSRKV
jgi:hypothetical protein